MSNPPTFHMPIIGPPQSGVNPEEFYNTVENQITVKVTNESNEGILINITGPSPQIIYSISAGAVTFIPGGEQLPTGASELSPGEGTLVLTVPPWSFLSLQSLLPSGVPAMTKILYLNVAKQSVNKNLRLIVNKMNPKILKGILKQINETLSVESLTTEELKSSYLEQILASKGFIFVESGTPLCETKSISIPNASDRSEFSLRFLDGSTPSQNLSPIPHLKAMPKYGGKEKWVGHPLIKALSDVSTPVDIYAKFEVWNLNTKVYESLPKGIPVDLMDYDPVSDDDRLAQETTDANGMVHFSIPDLQSLDETNPDLYLLVHTARIGHAGHKELPLKWSTKGWRAVDGSPGFFDEFQGVQIGKLNEPVTYRIGVGFHLRLTYRDPNATDSEEDLDSLRLRKSPPGVRLDIVSNSPLGTHWTQFTTDPNGEVHAVLFDIEPGDQIYFRIPFEISDKTINLPKAKVILHNPQVSEEDESIDGWETRSKDEDYIEFPDIETSTVGIHETPIEIHASSLARNRALFWLKILREAQTFLFHITKGQWRGVQNLEIYNTSLSGKPYAWPIGVLNLPPETDRITFIHEFAHQVMWKVGNYSSLGLLWQNLFKEFSMDWHDYRLMNTTSAFTEGWAEFFSAIFADPLPDLYKVSDLLNEKDESFNPPRNLFYAPNAGEKVINAFVEGLLRIFRNHIKRINAVQETYENGDVLAENSWLKDKDVQSAFEKLIWKPLKDLASQNEKTTTAFLDRIRANNAGEWHRIRAKLNEANMATAPPRFASIIPDHGPAATFTKVKITGENFVEGMKIFFRNSNQPAKDIEVQSDEIVSLITPNLPVGSHNIILETKGGADKKVNGYTCT